MRILLPTLLFFSSIATAQSTQSGWKLVWSDEFNGPANSAPDTTKWARDLGGGGWGNQELETYTNSTDNAYLDGAGNLVIVARQTSPGVYTSARLKTQGNFSTTYGRIEARIKIPYGQGLWPAFWMLGDNINSVSWPTCGEVDIMENIGKEPSIVHGTVHGPGYSGGNGITAQYVLPNSQKFSADFHVFEAIWTPTSVEFFVDSISYKKVTTASLPAGTQWVFNHGFFLLLNVAVGGGWPGNPDATTSFPQTMTVDYVRVYQPDIPPTINAGGIVNAASFATPLAPGSLATLFGSGLADGTTSDLFDTSHNAFVQNAVGSSVLVNGQQAPLTYVSSAQINFQVPWATPVGAGATVQVVRNGVASNSASITLSSTAPSAFSSNGAAIVTCAGGSPSLGADCTLWGNGFGPTMATQQDGVPSPSLPLPTATNGCSLTIGGLDAPVSYCGAAPGLVIDQMNFRYPAASATGSATLTALLTVGSNNIAFPVPGLP
jgi:uncharacterized protein (TIGR03437 family)